MKTVTIVSTWEAETDVELTDEEYAEFVASGDPPDSVLGEMNTANATLVDWKRKPEIEPPSSESRINIVIAPGTTRKNPVG